VPCYRLGLAERVACRPAQSNSKIIHFIVPYLSCSGGFPSMLTTRTAVELPRAVTTWYFVASVVMSLRLRLCKPG